jgi:hypothetical protein
VLAEDVTRTSQQLLAGFGQDHVAGRTHKHARPDFGL